MPPRAMSSEIYSGAIDWDKVYRAFHYPSRVAERILADLNGSADSVVFSGFAETAAFLADKLPVTFVDDSPSVTARARERYPKLGGVLTGDVTQLLALLPATHVAIACRISAYWNSTEQFQRLANSGRSMFPEYDVEVGTSLLDSDPSFLLKLVRKRAG